MDLTAYTRVSTSKQADDGAGLEVQRDQIAAWAKANGHRIVAWREDAGLSGSLDLGDRYGLADALDDVRCAKTGGVVVYRLDRLARDLALQEQYLAQLQRWGGRVFSTVEDEDRLLDDDSTEPARKLIRQILGAVSEFERNMIRLRMQAGIKKKRAAGGYVGGSIPYGWKLEHGELVECEPEQAQRALILAMRATGSSYRAICATLEGSGVPAPKGGNTWHPISVKRIAEYQRN